MVQVLNLEPAQGVFDRAFGQFFQNLSPGINQMYQNQAMQRFGQQYQQNPEQAMLESSLPPEQKSAVMDAILQSNKIKQAQEQQKAFEKAIPTLTEELMGVAKPTQDSTPEEIARFNEAQDAVKAFGPAAMAKAFEKRQSMEEKSKLQASAQVRERFMDDLNKRPQIQGMKASIGRMREYNTFWPGDRSKLAGEALMHVRPFLDAVTGGRGVLSNPKFKAIMERAIPTYWEFLPGTTEAKIKVLETLVKRAEALSDIQQAIFEASGGNPSPKDLSKVNREFEAMMREVDQELSGIEKKEEQERLKSKKSEPKGKKTRKLTDYTG